MKDGDTTDKRDTYDPLIAAANAMQYRAGLAVETDLNGRRHVGPTERVRVTSGPQAPGGDPKPHMIKLIIIPEAEPQNAGRFTARLESTGQVIVANTKQPLVDGARELLARGFDPATPLTMRLIDGSKATLDVVYGGNDGGNCVCRPWLPRNPAE